MNKDFKMMQALKKFQEAATEIAVLWESTDGSGVTPFDEILEKNYPFKEAFFETEAEIRNWTSNAVKELKERD